MSDTKKSIKDATYTPAKTVSTCVTSETHTTSPNVLSVPTSRREGKVKLRIAPREMPERKTTTTTV